MPTHVLSNAKIDKMVDDVPRKMFSGKFLVAAYAWNRYDPFVSLLPSTFLNVALFRPCTCRMERLRYLSIAAAVVSFYTEALNRWTRLTGAERRRQPLI
jgi:hypothetical protein